jgi:hypothetical protein
MTLDQLILLALVSWPFIALASFKATGWAMSALVWWLDKRDNLNCSMM